MGRFPLVTQLLADFLWQGLVGVQHDAGLSVVSIERRGVLLKRPGQHNRVTPQLNRNLAVDAVKRQPADVHDLVAAIRCLPASSRVRVQVGQRAVVLLNNLHAARMQSVNLRHTATVAGHLELVGTAVEAQVQAHLLNPLVPRLPCVWATGKHVVERQVFRTL